MLTEMQRALLVRWYIVPQNGNLACTLQSFDRDGEFDSDYIFTIIDRHSNGMHRHYTDELVQHLCNAHNMVLAQHEAQGFMQAAREVLA